MKLPKQCRKICKTKEEAGVDVKLGRILVYEREEELQEKEDFFVLCRTVIEEM